MQMYQKIILSSFISIFLGSQAYQAIEKSESGQREAKQKIVVEEKLASLPDLQFGDPQNQISGIYSSAHVRAGTTTDVLIFNGQGVSTSDWQNIEGVVKSMGLSYTLVNTSQMNFLSFQELIQFGLIIIPGGHRGILMSGLSDIARLHIKKAVRDYGVSYLGFSAGAFAAVGSLADSNQVSEDDLAVVYGKHLSVWNPNEESNVAATVGVNFPDGSARSVSWLAGPSTPEWQDGVVARYSNGEPAISEGWSEKGFVVLSGIHPEAPQSIKNIASNESGGLDTDLARDLILSALKRTPMPTFETGNFLSTSR